jgi:hypothetical protein
MTRVEYRDTVGNVGSVEEMYKVIPSSEQILKKSSLTDVFNAATKAKETAIKENLEAQGLKVVSSFSTPISKRRYKRKTAKMIKRANLFTITKEEKERKCQE